MLDITDTTDTNDIPDHSTNSGSRKQPVTPESRKPFDTPERSDTVRGIIRVSILVNVFKDVVAIPPEHWTFLLKLSDLDGDELTWLQIGKALDPKIDPDEWLDKRTITRLKRNAIRAWNRFRKWQEAEGWALVMRSPGGLRANQENVPLAERDKLVSLFDFVFLRVLTLAFDDARASHLWRKGQRSEALRRALEPLVDQLRLEPGESVEWERTEVAAPNTKGALATPQRYETGLETILKRYPKDVARRRLILKEHGEWLDRMNATYGDGPKGTEATPATPAKTRAYTISLDRIYAKSVHTPTRCSSANTGDTGSEKVLVAPFSSPDPCTLLSSSVSVQTSKSQGDESLEDSEFSSEKVDESENPITGIRESHEMESTHSSPSSLPADLSSNPTKPRASYSFMTLESFAAYTMLPIEWLVSLGIGMRKDQGRSYLGIPHLDMDGTPLGMKQRVQLKGKPKYVWVEGSAGLYGADWGFELARQRPALILCEGITDQLTFRYHHIPCVGLSSATTFGAIQAHHLKGIANIIICRDDDDGAGKDMAWNLTKHLRTLGWWAGVSVLRFAEAKDASAIHKLVKGETDAFKAAFNRANRDAYPMKEASDLPVEKVSEAQRRLMTHCVINP